MNNINDRFDELFGKEENKQTVLLYLSSFMGHKNNPQDLSVKMHQAQLLQVYLENSTVHNKEFYIEIAKDILQIYSNKQ